MQHERSVAKQDELNRKRAYDEGFADGLATRGAMDADYLEQSGFVEAAQCLRKAKLMERDAK